MVTRLWQAARTLAAEGNEAWERVWLLNHPWEEDFLHWVGQGASRRLHGHLSPPANGRPYSVTRGGWCPGLAVERQPTPGEQYYSR